MGSSAHPLYLLHRTFVLACAALLLVACPVAPAQEVQDQAIPFTVWLDFDAMSQPNAPRTPLPIWLETVREERVPAQGSQPARTAFRLYLRSVGPLNNEVMLRVFFRDLPEARPEVSAWTETGSARFQSPALGAGLGLPTSETVLVPLDGASYVEVSVPGTGENIRGVFLSTVEKTSTRRALDFEPTPALAEPFGAAPRAVLPTVDSRLFGRIRATLEDTPFKLSSTQPAEWELALERQPELALLSFDLLYADLGFLPQIYVNGRPLGTADAQLPDLADPAFQGEVRPRERDPRFRYSGWIRCQKLIPSSYLKAGDNALRIVLSPAAGEIAVRGLEIQLKQNR